MLLNNQKRKKMKKSIIALALFLLIPMHYACEKSEGPEPQQKNPKQIELKSVTEQLISADNRFGFELMQNILKEQESQENTMISPVSISLALAMTYNGADGETKTAMEQTLHLDTLTRKQINESYKALIEALLTVDPKVTMEIANSIWYRQGFQVEQPFIDINKEYYDAKVDALDFSSPDAVKTINTWVAEKTHDKIDKIVEKIDPLTVMYLINAIYFNGKWKFQFDEEKTAKETFYFLDGNDIQTETMVTEEKFGYFSNDLFQAVQLPYGRGNYSMVCFRPNENHNANEVINAMTEEKWNLWMDSLQQKKVQIHLPKFTFEYKKELGDLLKLMGMEIAFSPNSADFSRINPNRKDLHISKVLHKTFIEVDEKGTEAAAVTSVTVNVTSVQPSQPLVVRFNKPFVFAIREVTTNTIVFMGIMTDPRE